MSTTIITLSNHQFTVTAPYVEGHICSPGEAHALNRLRATYIKDAFARRLKTFLGTREASSLTSEDLTTLQSELDALDAQYALKTYEASRGVDPVQQEALRIARSKVEERLRANKVRLEDISEEKLKVKIAQVASMEAIRSEAARRVKALGEAAEDLLGMAE